MQRISAVRVQYEKDFTMMKKMLAFGFCLSVLNSFAQNHSFWKETPAAPAASGIVSIAVNPANDVLYAGTIRDGIFKSDNNGNSWVQLLNTDTAIVKILVAGQGNIYAIGGNTVFRTSNNGQTWQRAAVNTQYPITDIEILSNSALIVSTAEVVEVSPEVYDFKGDGVFMSTDGGVNWVQKNLGINYRKAITHLAVTSDDMIYAAMASYDGLGGGLYYSENLAASWTRVHAIKFNNVLTYEIASIYVITCLETDKHDSVYFAYDGSGGNYGMSGGLKSTTDDIVFGAPWMPERISNSGYNWQYRPFNSIHFAKNGRDVYSSYNTVITSALGGPYFKSSRGGVWNRVPGGILPKSYLTTYFAETSVGRVYAVQHGDNKVYYTDTSASATTVIRETTAEEKFVMYPNPASSKVLIKSKTTDLIREVAVVNMNGQTCLHTSFKHVSEAELEVHTLTSGLYMLQVTTENGISYGKLVIQ